MRPGQTIRVQGEMLQLRAAMPPDTWNERTGEVEVIFATAGARTKRWRPEIGDFYEELGLDENEVDLSRLRSAGPVLNAHGKSEYANHSTPGLQDQVATVVDAWSDGQQAAAKIRMIDRPDLQWVRSGVRDGDFAKLSVGYKVHRFVWIGDAPDGLPIYRAVSWTPFELSLLPISEDAFALTRSASDTHTETFEMAKHLKRPAKTAGAAGAAANPAQAPAVGDGAATQVQAVEDPAGDLETRAAQPAAPVVETPAAAPQAPLETRAAAPAPVVPALSGVEQGQLQERNRASEINRLAGLPGVIDGQALAIRAIQDGSSVESFRSTLFEGVLARDAAGSEANQHGATHGLEVGDSGESKEMRAMSGGLEFRCGAVAELPEGSRVFVGRSLIQLATRCLELQGVHVHSMTRDQIIQRAMTSSDFPLMLANTVNKRVIGAYQAIPRTFTNWARRSVANDFKARSIVRLGAGSAPVLIPEDGTIPLGKLTEGGESYRLFEYGRRLAMTRQMVINDDTNTLDRVAAGLGARMAELEGDIVYSMVTTNPTLGDGNAVFHADHGNTGNGETVDIAGFSKARTAMRKQTDEDGMRVNAAPRHLVVPPELETTAQQNTMAIQPALAGSVNPFTGQFESISAEPRLTDPNDWYAFASNSLVESLEYAYLEGNETPTVELEEQFTTSGRQIRILHAFGAGWADWRGAYRETNV